MSHPPTAEQQAAIDAFDTGDDMVLEAGAGTGKTSTLKMLAHRAPDRRGVYFAYNKAIATEAQRDFPVSVRAQTAHSLAYRAVAQTWPHGALQARLGAARLPTKETSRILGANKLVLGEGRILAPNQVARVAMDTVTRFCYSADTEPNRNHVPQVNGADDAEARARLVAEVVPMARRAWADLSRPDGKLRFSHDCYLKVWALTEPVIEGDYLMLDEAQDANPLVATLFERQTQMQRIAVGDASQSIYGWRGATDAMSHMVADHRLVLSQSFRFGNAVAAEANKWLGLLEANLRLKGSPAMASTLAHIDRPDALLTRSNAEAVGQLMGFLGRGVRACVVGGGGEIRRLAEAAVQLQTQGWTWHPELAAFQSWGMVQDYVEQDSAGGDLKVAVKLIDDHGADVLISALDRSAPEKDAEVVISTAHKSKGREWGRVKIAQDFQPPRKNDLTGEVPLPSREEMMLAYVAVTRARFVLDRDGLEWVDQYLSGGFRAGALHAAAGR